MDITFRRDPTNWRPRINKQGSQKDQEQKAVGNYFLMDEDKLTKEEEEEDAIFEKPASKANSKHKESQAKDRKGKDSKN